MRVSCLVLILCGYVSAGVHSRNELPNVQNVNAVFGPNHYHLQAQASEAQADDDFINQLDSLKGIDGRSFIADLIKNTLEGFRDIVINGNDDIPVLDPLHIPYIGPFEYSTTGVRASASIQNFRMEGLRWYLVDHVTFNAIRLTLGLQVTVPWLTFTGQYDAQARVAIVASHRAGGNFRIFINRLVVSVDARLGTNLLGGGHLILRELQINIDIFDTQIHITGMTGSSLINNFINAFVQNLTQEVIQNELQNVSNQLSEELFDVINDILKDYTLNDILG